MYATWGPEQGAGYFRKLHDNGVQLLGGNAEVANQVGDGCIVSVSPIATTWPIRLSRAVKISAVVPDQAGEGNIGDADDGGTGERRQQRQMQKS